MAGRRSCHCSLCRWIPWVQVTNKRSFAGTSPSRPLFENGDSPVEVLDSSAQGQRRPAATPETTCKSAGHASSRSRRWPSCRQLLAGRRYTKDAPHNHPRIGRHCHGARPHENSYPLLLVRSRSSLCVDAMSGDPTRTHVQRAAEDRNLLRRRRSRFATARGRLSGFRPCSAVRRCHRFAVIALTPAK